jgi:hypothetical protein
MRTDAYTKVMLTVIAACLIYIALGRPGILPAVQAQGEPQHVILAGWSQSPASAAVSLGSQPLPVSGVNAGGAPNLVRQPR